MMVQENNLNRIIAQPRQYIIQQQANTCGQREQQNQLTPVNFVALESRRRNNLGSAEEFDDKPGYERYYFYSEFDGEFGNWIQHNIDSLTNDLNKLSSEQRQQRQVSIDNSKRRLEDQQQKFDEKIVKRLQRFIDQNVDLTHLTVNFGNVEWVKEVYLDFSKLPKLVFLSTPIVYDKEINLKNNKELEYLWFTGNPHYPNDLNKNDPILDRIDLSQNKKLKYLVFDRANLHSLNLSENRDLEHVDIRQTKIDILDLRNSTKITAFDKQWKNDNNRCFRQGEPWEIEEWFERGFVSCNMEDNGQQIKKQSVNLA